MDYPVKARVVLAVANVLRSIIVVLAVTTGGLRSITRGGIRNQLLISRKHYTTALPFCPGFT